MLLPLYDELTLSYPKINFSRAWQHPHQPGMDRFVGAVIVEIAAIMVKRLLPSDHTNPAVTGQPETVPISVD